MDLSHLKVLVTGGGGIGVGAGVCQALDQFGATLIINELCYKKAKKAAKKYKNALPIKGDISDEKVVKKMFKKINATVGPINGLVNNAGIGLSKAVHEIAEAEFDRVYGVNIKGLWLVTKYFVKQLLKNKQTGNIVNISSVHAAASQPNYTTYASTKAAIEGFTRSLAYELGDYNIRCNAIGPGMVHAEQNYDLIKTWADDPIKWANDFIKNQQVLHHFIEPIDCGYTAAFLLSNLSRSITGQTLYVDAGKTIMLFNRDYIINDD
jgi:NAD(P)-dependent dehydrogenase (short-subunit alcohol dehydrogenase family)